MDTNAITASITKHYKLLIGALVFFLIIIVLYGTANGIYNVGVQYEQQLNKEYVDAQNYLSTYISGFTEQTGVARVAGDQLDKVLLDAVKGRYENTSAGGGYQVNSPFFNALVEAYPEASTAQLVKLWENVQTYVAGGREGYRNKQSKLLDELRVYETWRLSGLVNRVFVGILGFPSQNLVAQIGEDRSIRGAAALDKMNQIVLTSSTLDAYNNGTLDPLKP